MKLGQCSYKETHCAYLPPRPGLQKAVMALVTVISVTVSSTIVGTWCQGAGSAHNLYHI